jgi:hypothetical protein
MKKRGKRGGEKHGRKLEFRVYTISGGWVAASMRAIKLPERVKINGDGRVIPFNSALHFCGLLFLEDTSLILRTLLKSVVHIRMRNRSHETAYS